MWEQRETSHKVGDSREKMEVQVTRNNDNSGRAGYQQVGLWLGPGIAVLMMIAGPPDALSDAAWRTAAMGMLMAVWWATEAVPIAVTALLPLVFFPLLGIANIHDTAAPFANKVIYLFVGGFMVALAMQRWNLHRRIALSVLQIAGGNFEGADTPDDQTGLRGVGHGHNSQR